MSEFGKACKCQSCLAAHPGARWAGGTGEAEVVAVEECSPQSSRQESPSPRQQSVAKPSFQFYTWQNTPTRIFKNTILRSRRRLEVDH